MDILFYNARIITMQDNMPTLIGCVAVKDGRIAYVGETEPKGSCERRIDCRGCILMPGLINTHAHVGMALLRGYADDYPLDEWLFQRIFPAEERIDEKMLIAGASLGLMELIRFGVTSVSDMYFHEPAFAQLALDAGIRASLSNAIVALGDGYDPDKDRAVRELDSLVANYHGAGGGRILADAAVHGEYTTNPAVWEFASEYAKAHGLRMQVHLSETKKEHDECVFRRGKTPAQVLADAGVIGENTVAAHGVWLTGDDMRLIAKVGANIAHCPTSNMKLASGTADVSAMLRAGINVSLGTDGCASNNTHDMLKEIKLAALIAKSRANDPSALTAYSALKLATVNGARAQGRGDLGCIWPGYEADIILVDTDTPSMQPVKDPVSAVVYAASGELVKLTMVQGRILYENGEFTTLDRERIIREANIARERLEN